MAALVNMLTDSEFAKIVAQSFSYAEVSRSIGYKGNGHSGIQAVKNRIEQMRLNIEHFNRTDALEQYRQKTGSYRSYYQQFSDESFSQKVADASSWNQLMLSLGYSHHYGRAYFAVKRRVEELELDISHFGYSSHSNQELDNTDVFTCPASCSLHAVRNHFKKRTEIPYRCSICGLNPVWNGKLLTLTMDHINGNPDDNRLENLRWVCPNCDRQLPTYGARNKKAYHNVSQENQHSDGRTLANAKRTKPLEDFPMTRQELKEAIRTKSITKVAQSVNLSDNALRKWLDKFGLPRHSRAIRKMSDAEWAAI